MSWATQGQCEMSNIPDGIYIGEIHHVELHTHNALGHIWWLRCGHGFHYQWEMSRTSLRVLRQMIISMYFGQYMTSVTSGGQIHQAEVNHIFHIGQLKGCSISVWPCQTVGLHVLWQHVSFTQTQYIHLYHSDDALPTGLRGNQDVLQMIVTIVDMTTCCLPGSTDCARCQLVILSYSDTS